MQRRERDDALRDQKHPLGVHPPQRRPVHLRKSRQPLRPVHDRRISGHLDPGVGKLPAPAGQRHGTVGTDLGADRGRHQTVDLPLAGRRLGDPAPPGGTGAGRSEHRNDTPEGEFPELAAGGGVQQPDDRQGGRKRQHGTEPTARPGSAARPGGKGPGRAARHPAGGLLRTRAERPQERAASRLRQYHPLRWRAAPHRTHQSSREQGVPPKRYDDSGAQRHGRHQSRLGTARLQAPEHGSPLPVRRDDAGGAHRRHGTDQFVRHRLSEAGHESCGFAEPGHLQPFFSQTLLRCGTHGRGGRLSQIAAAVPARRGVRTDRHAVRPSGATGGDRLPASRARTDHQLLRGPRSRHSPLPQMVGRTGKRPLAERRTGRNDHRNHHDTQGQGIGKKGSADPLLQLDAQSQIERTLGEHRLGRRHGRGTGGNRPVSGAV